MDRQAANTALAKAIAYVQCGKTEQASDWLTSLVLMFQQEGVVPQLDVEGHRVHGAWAVEEAKRRADMSAASAWLGGRLLGREGSVQL